MSATVTEHQSPPPSYEDQCPQCGAALESDQEWCLECGAARTLIHRPPDWRIPLAIVAGTAAVAVLVFVLVLSNLSGGSNPGSASTAGVTVAARNSPATGSVPGWPQGLGGWTVALFGTHHRAAAYARARRIAADGVQVGVLDTSLHPALHPGRWIVWSGRYPTRSAAGAAASQLISLGHPHAHALLVGRPA